MRITPPTATTTPRPSTMPSPTPTATMITTTNIFQTVLDFLNYQEKYHGTTIFFFPDFSLYLDP